MSSRQHLAFLVLAIRNRDTTDLCKTVWKLLHIREFRRKSTMWKVTQCLVASLYLTIVSLYRLVFWFETKRQQNMMEFLLSFNCFGYCRTRDTTVIPFSCVLNVLYRQHEFVLLTVTASRDHHLLHRVNETYIDALALLWEPVCLTFAFSWLCMTAAPQFYTFPLPIHTQSTGRILNGVTQPVGQQLEGFEKPAFNDH